MADMEDFENFDDDFYMQPALKKRRIEEPYTSGVLPHPVEIYSEAVEVGSEDHTVSPEAPPCSSETVAQTKNKIQRKKKKPDGTPALTLLPRYKSTKDKILKTKTKKRKESERKTKEEVTWTQKLDAMTKGIWTKNRRVWNGTYAGGGEI